MQDPPYLDDPNAPELPLSGGNSAGQVVRVGDTIRRQPGPFAPAVGRLLTHLDRAGFAAAPRFLGADAQGRDILSYLPGDTHVPAETFTALPAVQAAGRLLRRYHDASVSALPLPGPWARVDPSRAEVICHNDFAPYNLVWTDGLPTGVIDFDLAGPGPRLRDLAYLAYWVTPLSFAAPDPRPLAEAELVAGLPKLRALCAAYGGIRPDGALLAEVADVLAHMGSFTSVASMVGQAVAHRLAADGHLAHWQAEHAAYVARLPELQRALAEPRSGGS